MLPNTMKATDTYISESSQRELAAGVLKQAAQDLRRFHGANSAIERELYLDAYSWVMSDDCSWPFSFLKVCQLLNLVPEDVRQDLVGHLSLGTFSQWARRCARAVQPLQILLASVSRTARNVSAAEPSRLIHTSH
jgi:hypothetical protein